MYIVECISNHPKTCHDAGRCTSEEDYVPPTFRDHTPTDRSTRRERCIARKQQVLFEDGAFAYIHAGQDIHTDGIVYKLQDATTESLHLVDRCHRDVVKAKAIDSFGISMPVGDASKGLYVLDFEVDTKGPSNTGSGKAGQDLKGSERAAVVSEEGWEEVEKSSES